MQEDSVEEEGNARQMCVRRKIDFGNRPSDRNCSNLTADASRMVLVLRTAFQHLIWLKLVPLLAQKGAPALLLLLFLLGTCESVCVCSSRLD